MSDPSPFSDQWSGARAKMVAGALALVFAVVVGRAGHIAMAGAPAAIAMDGVEVVSLRRANIVDRNGDLLATSLPAWSLAADPGAIWDAREVAEGVAAVLPDLDVDLITERLSDKTRKFAWVRRGLTPRQRHAVMELGLEGLRFEEEMRRVHPAGHLAGHLVGYTNIDGKGVSGAEYLYDSQLVGGEEDLRLTIDAGVQFALESELERASEDFVMAGAAGVVIDAHTGAVRAMASWPFVDPNFPGKQDAEARRNRAVGAVYDLGSVYKPLTVAAALEAGVVSKIDTFDVSEPMVFGPETVTDGHEFENAKSVSVEDIVAQSSNIGTVKIAQQLGIDAQRDFLRSVGLFSKLEYDGPRSEGPLLPPEWTSLASATVSYGHGIAVTPLSFATSYLPLANGGEYLTPYIVETDNRDEPERRRVLSEAVTTDIVAMMRKAVLEGTGKQADAPGYEVAGKTGTAEKVINGVYDPDRNITSFAAIFPASRPEFVVLVVLDDAEPVSGGSRTAAYTAASIVGRLVSRAAPLLDVEPVLETTESRAQPGLGAQAEPEAL